jgi:hypothetical protein
VRHLTSQVRTGDPYPLKQRNRLFWNDRGRGFLDVTDASGPALAPLHVARGVATGDLDNDGDLDVVIFNNSGPARVLLNQVGSSSRWIGLRVLDGRSRRDAVQARVVLHGPDGRDMTRRVQTDGSYATAGDARVLFGLGRDGSPRTVRVHWPGGRIEEFPGLAVDTYWVLEPGKPPRRM